MTKSIGFFFSQWLLWEQTGATNWINDGCTLSGQVSRLCCCALPFIGIEWKGTFKHNSHCYGIRIFIYRYRLVGANVALNLRQRWGSLNRDLVFTSSSSLEHSSCFLVLQNTALPRLYLCSLAVVKDGTAADGYRLTQAFCSDCSANDAKKQKDRTEK